MFVKEDDKMKIAKQVLIYILTLFICLFSVLTAGLFCISSFASKENIIKQMKTVNLLTEVKKVKNSGAQNSNSKITNVINDTYSLASQFNVDEAVVDTIINSNVTKEIIGTTIGNLTDYAINGQNITKLSEKDTYNIINNNLPDLLKAGNITLNESQKEKFLRELKKQLPDIIEMVPTSKELLGTNYGSKIKLIQKLFSNQTKIIISAILLINIILVIILRRKDFKWALNLSFAFLLAGFILVAMSLLLPSATVTIMSQADLSLFASSLTGFLAKPILYSGLSIIALSIVLFTIYKYKQKKLKD